MLMFAIYNSGAYNAPAMAVTAYTVATVNNSFEGNLMGMIGFLDSPFMSFLLSMFLMLNFPSASVMSALIMLGACMPFFIDTGISMLNVHGELSRPSSTTVEEVEDDYQQQPDDNDDVKVKPSDRLLPEDVSSNKPLANLLTRNWKDHAYNVTNPVEK